MRAVIVIVALEDATLTSAGEIPRDTNSGGVVSEIGLEFGRMLTTFVHLAPTRISSTSMLTLLFPNKDADVGRYESSQA